MTVFIEFVIVSNEILWQPEKITKALTALVDRLSLSVGCVNGPERVPKTVSFNP